MKLNYYLPVCIVIFSNILYHNATKNTPKNVNSFLSLSVTYIIGAFISLLIYFFTRKSINFLLDLHKLNWTSYFLGVSIVGLEVGYIYMYRSGWQISKGSLLVNILVAVVLIILGILLYKESLNLKNWIGIVLCILGIIFINK